MATFHANEFTLTLPARLKDKTVHIFSLTDEGPSDLGVVIARDRPLAGEALDAFAERQLKLLAERLPLFRLLNRAAVEVDRAPAAQMDYSWQAGETQMHQRQVVIHAPEKGVMLIITATTKARLEPQWEAVFGELLADLRLRR